MNQCPNCGQTVADTARFCPACGAALKPAQPPAGGQTPYYGQSVPGQTPPYSGQSVPGQTLLNGQAVPGQVPPPPAKKGRKAAGIAAAVAAVAALAAAGALLLPRLFRAPEKEFIACQQEALAAPLLSLLESKVDLGGAKAEPLSTDMTLTIGTDYPDAQAYLENTSLELKLDSTQDSFVLNGELNLMGSPVLSGSATYEDGRLGLCLPELDENYYVMDLAQAASRLTGEELDLGGAKAPEASGKEWAALIRAYLDISNSIVTRDNVTLEKRQTFTLEKAGGTFTGDVYTFTPTAADVETVLNKLAGHLEEDRDLRALLLKLADEETLLAALDNAYESLDDALADAVACLRENAARAGRTVEDSGFTWTVYREGKAVRMVRWETNGGAVVLENAADAGGGAQELYAAAQGETLTVFRNDYSRSGDDLRGEAVLGVEGSKMTLRYEDRNGVRKGSLRMDSEGDILTADYRLEEHSASLSMTVDGETISLDLQWDDEARSALGIPYGSYTMGVDSYADDVEMTLEVSAGARGGSDHVLTLRTPEAEDGISRVTFSLHTTDKKATAVKPGRAPTDITDYSEEELAGLADSYVYALYGQLMAQLGSLFYGL